ncbi:MAG: hypothetical protein HZB46_09175 [Solirubrobacterales bacterium]|nr:hypothetical protein [Solirubrobacterales bacterium]
MSGRPLWRRGFDALERPVGDVIAGAVQSQPFADGVALGLHLERLVRREVERGTRRWLHAVNLPTATDVRRLSQQVAELQRQVRALSHELDALETAPPPRRRSARSAS